MNILKGLMLCVMLLLASGCSDFPLRFRASEPIKRGTQQAVANIDAVLAHVRPTVKPFLEEAREAMTDVVQPYVGLPAHPVKPGENMDQAKLDALRKPTMTDVAEFGFGTVGNILAVAGAASGISGAGWLTKKANSWRKELRTIQPAVIELVGNVEDALDGKPVKKAFKEQSLETQAVVAHARIKMKANGHADYVPTNDST